MKIPTILLVLLVSSGPVGCATTSSCPRVDPREIVGRPVSAAVQVPVQLEDEQVAIAQVACGGAFATRLGPSLQVVHFRLRIRNLDPATVNVPLDGLRLEGVAGESLRNPLALIGQERARDAIAIAAGASREIDVIFQLPGGVDVDDVNGFTLAWGVEVAGHLVTSQTSFAASSDDHLTGRVARAFRPTL